MINMNHLAHIGDVLAMHARMYPDKVGARDLERAMTFREWNNRSCRLANALIGVGLSKGDRICILAYNCLEWMEIYAATALAGLIAVPINFRLVGPEIAYIVENCEAKALIVQDELLDAVESVRMYLPIPTGNFISIGGSRRIAGCRGYEDLITNARDGRPRVNVTADDPWTLMYTSGTTGTPKGAIRSHKGSAMLSLVTEVELSLTSRDVRCWLCPCVMRTLCTSSVRSLIAALPARSTAGRVLIPSISCARSRKGARLSPRWCRRITS
jgi:acyl-CoA synthetase (AMP-forming)/AMP-acid ligase II